MNNTLSPRTFLRALFMALALCSIAGGSLAAQTTSGSLRGYITGPGGAAISNAQVVARLAATNESRGTTTNASGFYYLPGLRPGVYEISIRRVGLQPQTRSLQLQIGQTLDLNVSTSEIAAQLEAVQVTAERGQETQTSEVSTNISREQINNLPNFERNVLDLAKLVPGMSAQAVNNGDKFFAAGGQPSEAVNVFVDGATYKNDVLKGGVVGQDASKGNPFPQGAIQEFRVLTQNYKAEYQKAASAIIVATTRS
ncbi:MAG: carboxypeptidase-like regulatory domain-containing protein, partial [Gemmatimonadota bacterium]|nr:carboxypeptidase-like regulatory domain-containing protein [Gemmatimonadota bacterium]